MLHLAQRCSGEGNHKRFSRLEMTGLVRDTSQEVNLGSRRVNPKTLGEA